MMSRGRLLLPLLLSGWLVLLRPPSARAAEAGVANEAGASGVEAGDAGVPVACSGKLCDTTTGSTCGVARHAPGGGSRDSTLVGIVLASLGLGRRRRRNPAGVGHYRSSLLREGRARVTARSGMLRGRLALRRLGSAGLSAALTIASPAVAAATAAGRGDRIADNEPEPAVDVAIPRIPRPRRVVSAEWNPLPLFTIGKLSGNLVITPFDHHALVLSPFYAWATTAPVYIFDDGGAATQLPEQKFRGFGAELGYRYYFDEGGPRGLFLGPSLILASFTATAMDGAQTRYWEYGLAADAGYQMLAADAVALSLGGGLEGVWTSTEIPKQQFPAKLYATRGLLPRLLCSVGWAF